MQRAVLIPHPSTVAPSIHGVAVFVAGQAGGALSLSFGIEGDIDRLRVPSRTPPRRTDGLWRHTCFEAFLMAGNGPGYHEVNFSPSGAWAAYAFSRYRDGGPLDIELEPAVLVRNGRDRLQVDAVVPAECLPPTAAGAVLRLGLAAVLEAQDGTLSYWALRHPVAHPDFHHADGFGLDLARRPMRWS